MLGCGATPSDALTLPPSRLSQRIVYRYPALAGLRENECYRLDPRTGTPLLSVVSAQPLTDGTPTSSEVFTGRVVVIGGSFEAGNDLHPTPLGVMPGPLVLVNAIDSLLEHGEVRAPGRAVSYAVVVAQVIAVAWLFGRFRSIPPAVAACAVLGGLFLPASVLLFKDGYWLDFGLPFVGIQIHRVVARLHEMMGH
jgi:CHASE2 domain-containing sensor protein